jgi:CRP/FNR family transcriptional regulator, cyclic AMP receptor protein
MAQGTIAMDETKVDQLSRISLFTDVPRAVLAPLAEKVKERCLETGERLVREGDQGDSMFVIVAGKVKIVKENTEGSEIILNHCGPGEAIGEMSLLDQEPRSASVFATVPTQLLELKQEIFLDILDQQPEIALMLIRSMSSRLRFSTTYIQQAIEWSKHVAEGDYSVVMNEIQTAQPGQDEHDSDKVKAGKLLSAFFQMVKGVKAREDKLKQELQKLTLEIDEVRREQQVREVTSTDFYTNLKAQAAQLRKQRDENQ